MVPLIFNHGREAYRRNSYLVIYMFYKNVMFTVAQFWFGFENAFSGQTLYEPFLYQGYNLVFTAFPIIWFSVYDLQYTKSEFLKNPSLYSIGLNNECFSTIAFFSMIFNAIMNGLVITFLCFFCEDGYVVPANAKNADFWFDGTMVYAATVLIVNLAILQKTNAHSAVSIFWFVGSVGSFWGYFYLENLFSLFPQLYEVFIPFSIRYETWLILGLSCWFTQF